MGKLILNKLNLPNNIIMTQQMGCESGDITITCLLDSETLKPHLGWLWVTFKNYPDEHWDNSLFFDNLIKGNYDRSEVGNIDTDTIIKVTQLLKYCKKLKWF
jgi:hypothetical protein